MTVIELAGSRLDDWWGRMLTDPRVARAWALGGPGIVLLVAALTRLIGLGFPHELVFDETYYVKDAYTLMNLGYEAAWPPDANTSFNAGLTDIYSTVPSFIAHPPIGKWVIAVGLAVFGAGDSVGWRISVAVCGILLVLVTMLIARILFRSTLMTVIAGGLLAIDGNAIVMSRVALLDTILALFVLVGVLFVLLDRQATRARIDAWMLRRQRADRSTDRGPVLWRRPWLLAASLAFGLASGVKWSGLYFLAAFALYALIAEIVLRRQAGIRAWPLAIATQGPVTFLLTVPLALGVYVASWAGWFATSGGYYRSWIEDEGGQPWTGILAGVPYDLQNWWHYQAGMYGYHVNEHTPHNYQANPLTWLFLVRPTSMYYREVGADQAGTILGLANPLIWWAATAAALFLVVRVAVGLINRQRVWREAFILTGLAAGYLPWLLYLGRTVFQFYTIAFEPYLVLGLTLALGVLMGSRTDPAARRRVGLWVVGVFLALCVLLSIFFWPIWTGQPIPKWYMQLHFWFRSWV